VTTKLVVTVGETVVFWVFATTVLAGNVVHCHVMAPTALAVRFVLPPLQIEVLGLAVTIRLLAVTII
jgi:hypothetical protein